MKTVIYYNVTTGESFDQEGNLRTQNNPFTASYGEQRVFEWHLVAASNPALPVSEWLPWTDWEITPDAAFTAADDNYLAAYPGTLKEPTIPGDSAISVSADSLPGTPAPSGIIRIHKQDRSVLQLSYSAVNELSDGAVFAVEIPENEEFPAGTRVDILEEPLVHSSAMISGASTPDEGIFSFDLKLSGWRLSEKMEYSDTESLSVKGLELCVTGTDAASSEQIALIRCQVPFLIKNVIALYPF